MAYPSPCDTCTREKCPKCACAAWKIRYLHRQKQINAYARHNGVVPDAPKHQPGTNPCNGCRWEESCDSICKARADYWDERMKLVRKGLGQ